MEIHLPSQPPDSHWRAKLWKFIEGPWTWGGIGVLAGALISPHTFKYLYVFAYLIVCIGFLKARLFTGLQSWVLSAFANLIACSLLGFAFWAGWGIVPKPKDPPSLDEFMDAFAHRFPFLGGQTNHESQKPPAEHKAAKLSILYNDEPLDGKKLRMDYGGEFFFRYPIQVKNDGNISARNVYVRLSFSEVVSLMIRDNWDNGSTQIGASFPFELRTVDPEPISPKDSWKLPRLTGREVEGGKPLTVKVKAYYGAPSPAEAEFNFEGPPH